MLGKYNYSRACSLKASLAEFETYMGLSINHDKSMIVGSLGSTQSDRMQEVLGLKEVHFPLKYLGLPLVADALKLIHFNDLFYKLTRWLEGWKSKYLSLGGRLQLLHSSINNLLSFWFGSVFIPKGIIKKLTSLTAKIFYHIGDGKKLYLTSWSQNAFPRSKGGISLNYVSTLNSICKIKSIWKVLLQSSKYGSFWAK